MCVPWTSWLFCSECVMAWVVGMVGMAWWSEWIILEVFSSLYDAILWFYIDSESAFQPPRCQFWCFKYKLCVSLTVVSGILVFRHPPVGSEMCEDIPATDVLGFPGENTPISCVWLESVLPKGLPSNHSVSLCVCPLALQPCNCHQCKNSSRKLPGKIPGARGCKKSLEMTHRWSVLHHLTLQCCKVPSLSLACFPVCLA